LIHFTSVLRKQFAANDTFLREVNSYKRALALRNSRLVGISKTLNKGINDVKFSLYVFTNGNRYHNIVFIFSETSCFNHHFS